MQPRWAMKNMRGIGPSVRRAIKLGDAPGFYGQHAPHLLTYIPGQVPHIFSLCGAPDLTAFNSVKTLLRYTGWMLFSIMLAMFCYYTLDEADTKLNNSQLRAQLEEFRFLIAFILSSYIAAIVGIWKLRRTNYASLCGNARNLSIKISGCVPLSGEGIPEARAALSRWILLAFELAMAKARGVVDTEVTRDYLARAGLLTEGEWEALVDGDRHTTVFWWLIVRLRQLRDAGMLNRQDFPMLVDAVGQMRGQANDLMSSLDRDNPYPYVQLIGLLVKVNLFIFASWKGFALAVFAFQFGGFGAMFGHGIVWYNLVFTLLWNASYAALCRREKLERPAHADPCPPPYPACMPSPVPPPAAAAETPAVRARVATRRPRLRSPQPFWSAASRRGARDHRRRDPQALICDRDCPDGAPATCDCEA